MTSSVSKNSKETKKLRNWSTEKLNSKPHSKSVLQLGLDLRSPSGICNKISYVNICIFISSVVASLWGLGGQKCLEVYLLNWHRKERQASCRKPLLIWSLIVSHCCMLIAQAGGNAWPKRLAPSTYREFFVYLSLPSDNFSLCPSGPFFFLMYSSSTISEAMQCHFSKVSNAYFSR